MSVRVRIWNMKPFVGANVSPDLREFDRSGTLAPDVDVVADRYTISEGALEIVREAKPGGLAEPQPKRALGFPLHTIATYLVEELP